MTIQLIQTLAMAILFMTVYKGQGFYTLNLWSFGLPVETFEFNIGILVCVQLGVSFLHHFVILSRHRLGHVQYSINDDIRDGQTCNYDKTCALSTYIPDYLYVASANTVRWLEYSISGSVMLAVITILTGVTDALVICSVFLFMALLQYTGFIAEKIAYKSVLKGFNDLGSLDDISLLGFFMHFNLWVYLISQFLVSLAYSEKNPPEIVYFIIFIMFFFFTTFGVVHYVHIKSVVRVSKFSTIDTRHQLLVEIHSKAEVAYALLSIVSKSTLTYMLLGGVLRPREE